ncbi:MAG: ABC transporter ATP-binding protein [Erysipelotrichaceae bacterium]|nr:ABC transporter ATP-binding protein [Erysipelotrichaceae bacterium]
MIEIKNLNKHFGQFHALKGISLRVKENEIYGFIGHNGAGKSTTMNIMAGLSHFEEGSCIINGQDVKELAKPGDLNVGFLPENPQFYPWMNATEYLLYCSKNPDKQKVKEIIAWAGLEQHASRKIKGFSRGMKQRLGLAVALINDPKLIILDEPSSALDPEGRSEVLRLMVELKNMGKTIIFSSHILSDIERICDRIGMIENGEIIFEKSLVSLLNENVKPIFDIEFKHMISTLQIERLMEHKDILKVEAKDNMLTVQLKQNDLDPKSLLESVLEFDVPILGFNLRKNNLESLFIKEGN